MAKQTIPKTHYVEEEPIGTYQVQCGNPDCENCDWIERPSRESAEKEAADLNLIEAISADIVEEIRRMAKDYGVSEEDIIGYFRDVRWLREAMECPAK